ncbi:hypothetical protein Ac42p111 [Acinetobacter phage Ac42]|uniref:hypothetical protein n=1 Tax=Acinetobacter phage Ac42 TaxID=762660 RepID=UPI0001EBCD09|nr:hypothetical protein Ac42p111 [Acinetobacter phage Ac42]ADI96349.1 hypothetical protein Ac42p111 [Acinetobacter phage Ac42]
MLQKYLELHLELKDQDLLQIKVIPSLGEIHLKRDDVTSICPIGPDLINHLEYICDDWMQVEYAYDSIFSAASLEVKKSLSRQ